MKALPANVLPFRKKTRDLASQFVKPDSFTDRIAHHIKTSSDVPILSPSGIVALEILERDTYALFILPPESFTPVRLILSLDQIYSLIHALDFVIERK